MKKLLRLDATALSKSSCNLRLKYTVINGYRQSALYNDTVYGLAGHKFNATMALTNGNFQESLMAAKKVFNQPKITRAKKEHLTENHFIKTCFDFWEHLESKSDSKFIVDSNGKPLVEMQFAIKIYEDESCIVEVCGTLDKVEQFNHGMVAIGDYKYTSSWNASEYFKQHRLAPQLKTYRWALYKLASMSPEDSILRQITKYPVGMFIDGVFLKSGKDTEFSRSEVWCPKQDEIEEFDELLLAKAMELASIYRVDWSIRDGMINGSCSNSYGTSSVNGALCQFYNVCSAVDKVAGQYVLKNEFVQREYDPLAFGED